jgi:hypothetical protein
MAISPHLVFVDRFNLDIPLGYFIALLIYNGHNPVSLKGVSQNLIIHRITLYDILSLPHSKIKNICSGKLHVLAYITYSAEFRGGTAKPDLKGKCIYFALNRIINFIPVLCNLLCGLLI